MLSEDGFMRNTSRRTVYAKPVRAWSGRWRRDGIDWHRPGGAFHAKRYVRRFGATASLPKAAAIRVDVDMFGSASPDAAFVDASGSTLHVKLWMRRAAHHARSTPVVLRGPSNRLRASMPWKWRHPWQLMPVVTLVSRETRSNGAVRERRS